MSKNSNKKAAHIAPEVLAGRVRQMLQKRAEYICLGVNNLEVDLMDGNSKTGENCKTVSLIPWADCPFCKFCKHDCYDCRNVCWQPGVQNQRAKNSAIHALDSERYFWQIARRCEEEMVRELRLNVGGDLNDEDFALIDRYIGKLRGTETLFFTHNHEGINAYLDVVGKFHKNIHALISVSRNQPWDNAVDNRHNLPLAHIRYEDGKCETLDALNVKPSQVFGCGGNCSRCFWEKKGCPSLKKGQHMVFDYH